MKKYEIKAEIRVELTQEDIDDIMVAALEGGIKYGAVQGHEVDCCNIDAGCADAIIQYSLFGEVVYG